MSHKMAKSVMHYNGWRNRKLVGKIYVSFGQNYRILTQSFQKKLEIDALYSGYLERQAQDIATYQRDKNITIPEHLDFSSDSQPFQRDTAKITTGTAKKSC